MCQNSVIVMVFIACWLCSITVFGGVAPKGPLRSNVIDGYKAEFELYCSDSTLPSSIICLKNGTNLNIESTPFL
jgi:hypothetical protein